jgi:ankyrin repeat protein
MQVLAGFLSCDTSALNAMMQSDPKQTPLHLATGWGKEDLARLLISHGADVKAIDCKGDTILSSAAFFGWIWLIEMILKVGGYIHAEDAYGDTALMSAASGGSVEAMKVLVQHGANINDRAHYDGASCLEQRGQQPCRSCGMAAAERSGRRKHRGGH